MQLTLQSIVLGNDPALPREKLKEALLRGEVSIIMMLVATTYLIADLRIERFANYPLYFILLAAAVISFLSNRAGRGGLAAVLILLPINLLTYVFAASDTNHGAVNLFFVCNALAAFLVFGKRRLFWSLFFSFFSFGLFALAWVCGSRFVSVGPVPEWYAETNLLINYIVAFCVVVLAAYFLTDAQLRVEQKFSRSESQLLGANEMLQHDNNRLIKTNHALDRFVFGASHDLKAPLSSISGLLKLAQAGETRDEINRYLALIGGRVSVLERFIHDLIDLAKNTHTEVTREPIRLGVFVRELVFELQFQEESRHVDFKIEIDDRVELPADAVRLRVILMNLMNNALKYRDPKKGKTEIRVAVVVEPQTVRICVEDNGLGIDSQHLPRIFDLFYRAHPQKNGSGIGLYLVKEATVRLGGEVIMESELGHGSRVTIVLPAG